MKLFLEHKCPKCHEDFKVEVTHNLSVDVTEMGCSCCGTITKVEVDWTCPHCKEYGYDYTP